MSASEPLLGWRLWRLRGARLESWAASYTWEPGENIAYCLAPLRRCPRSPGRGCRCGFWALHGLLQCVERARAERSEGSLVLGLVRAWGEIAMHGQEGFRAERAAVACLVTDWPWDVPPRPQPAGSSLARWWWHVEQVLHFLSPPPPPDPWRSRMLQEAASIYGVPLTTVEDALRVGLLQELGASERILRDAHAWVGLRRRH